MRIEEVFAQNGFAASGTIAAGASLNPGPFMRRVVGQ